jgi:outer membrane lipoprotein SlyB
MRSMPSRFKVQPALMRLGVMTRLGVLLLCSFCTLAWADMTPKQRYEADLKLCADEPTGSLRLQCRRDAKQALDQARAQAGISPSPSTLETAPDVCAERVVGQECGRIFSVTMTEKEGEGSAVGTIAGGVAGALLGHQIGGGFGKDLATVAGAVGGAYAGKEIEKRVKSHTIWTIGVEFDDGNRGTYEFKDNPGWTVGNRVRKSQNTVVLLPTSANR